MKSAIRVIINGMRVEKEAAGISPFDPGFLSGWGIFTTARVEGGRIEFLERHIRRLKSHCREMGISFPVIKRSLLLELAEGLRGIWRLKIIVTPKNYLAFVEPYRPPSYSGKAHRLLIYPEPVCYPLARIKTISYAVRYYMARFAADRGFFDVLTTDHRGYLLEASFANIFWREGNALYMPSPKLPLMFGVSLSVVAEACQRMGMKVRKGRYAFEDIPDKAQFFLSSSLRHFQAIDAVEERKFFRDAAFERKLTKSYAAMIAGESAKRR